MGLKSTGLPDAIVRAMSKPDRKALGLSTLEETLCAQQIRQEREMHNLFANWLRLNGVPFIHARMDKKSTIRKGWPDFTLLCVLAGPWAREASQPARRRCFGASHRTW
jgi:hypothetical protein